METGTLINSFNILILNSHFAFCSFVLDHYQTEILNDYIFYNFVL